MKIISLRAENVKRLKAIEITPDGNVVVIAGRNAQGKSSVLDAIWMALAGAAGAKDTSKPIRNGQDKASVQLDLGELVVTRSWTKAGTSLHVAAKDGARYPTPQTVLDGLIGKLAFDPLAFAEQDPKRQLEMLLDVIDLSFNPAELAEKRQSVYDKRTEVNREVRRLEGAIGSVPAFPDDTPDEEVTATALTEQVVAASEVEQRRARLKEQGIEANETAKRLKRELAVAEKLVGELSEQWKALPDPVDVDGLRGQLAQVDATNEHVRARKQRASLEIQLDAVQKASAKLTVELEKIDQQKADAIAKAVMPLDGLGFDEDGVLYQGVPFSQASSAERLRVGIAMAMALNPKIRVIRITDGSLLDSENLALIEEMAGEHDFQVWIEKVDESGSVGVVIEDGMVAGAVSPSAPDDAEPAAAAAEGQQSMAVGA